MTFGGSDFKLNSILFSYGLSAKEISVYSYLSFCGGTCKACKVKMNTIATDCESWTDISPNGGEKGVRRQSISASQKTKKGLALQMITN